jgi:hypothetical protein
MWPREHGAWPMLLAPFLSALLLARAWHWSVPVALVAVLAAFVLREPLVALGRQRWVWRAEKPESAKARRWLVAELALLAAAGGMLALRWPSGFLLMLGGLAAAMTLLAAWMTARNRQRSASLELASAAGLTSTCLAASLSAIGRVEPWCWLLWALSAAHAAAGIFVVHARLEARIAARAARPEPFRFRRPAYAMQLLLLAGAAVCYRSLPVVSAALALSALVHLATLRSLRNPAALETPLTRVGLRAMALSLVYSALLVYGLW